MSQQPSDGLPALEPGAHLPPLGLEVVPVGPRLALTLCAIVAVSATPTLVGLSIQLASLLLLAAVLRRLPQVVGAWKTVAAVCVSLLVIYSWAYPGSTEFVWIFGVQGFIAGLRIVVRLLGFVTAMFLLLATTGPVAIVEWAGDVNEDLGIMVSLTLSVVPVMKQQMDVTMQAQAARGLNTDVGVIARARAYLTVLIPVVVKSLVRAYGMAALLHVRGYASGRRRPEPALRTAAVPAVYLAGLVWVAITVGLRAWA